MLVTTRLQQKTSDGQDFLKGRHMRNSRLIMLACVAYLAFTGCTDFLAKGQYQKARSLEAQKQYRSAVDKYEQVINKYPAAQFAESARVALKNLTSFNFVSRYAMQRVAEGKPVAEALGEFTGVKIIWQGVPVESCVQRDLPEEPVQFKSGDLGFLGVSSYGLDKLNYFWFCSSNEGETLTVEGTLLKASDLPGLPLIVGVNAVARP